MARRMLHYMVTVNDQPQEFLIGGDPAHVAASRLGVGPHAPHVVEFWAEGELSESGAAMGDGWRTRTFQVFGTGHPLPPEAVWWGTAARTPEGLVWHLYELVPVGTT